MIEVRNKTEGPTQLVVRSFSGATDDAVAFTVLNIPGRNTYYIEDDRVVQVYVERSEKEGLIAWRKVSNTDFEKLFDPNNPRQRYIPGYRQEKSISEEI